MLKGFPQQENRLRDSFPDTAKYKKDFCLDSSLVVWRQCQSHTIKFCPVTGTGYEPIGPVVEWVLLTG